MEGRDDLHGTRPARVVPGAGRIDVITESEVTVVTAREVGLTRIVRDVRAVVFDKVVRATVRTTTTTTGDRTTAVQQILDAQIDIVVVTVAAATSGGGRSVSIRDTCNLYSTFM
jgi:hypothetical protein